MKEQKNKKNKEKNYLDKQMKMEMDFYHQQKLIKDLEMFCNLMKFLILNLS